MSEKWYSRAEASVGRWDTLSQRSMVREVKPVVERKTSWLLGTWRMSLRQDERRSVSREVCLCYTILESVMMRR